MPDGQLAAALRAEVPSYDGTAPLNQGAAEFITHALEKIMQARGIPGRVAFSPQAVLGSKDVKYMFAVRDPSPKVCAIHVSGAAAIHERDLIAPLQGAVGGDYSRFFFSTAADGTLRDMYRRKGFWKAAFGTPAAALDACQGVAVTLPVSEGQSYTWDHAEWSGDQALGRDALDKAIGMKAGEVADSGKIEAGLRAVRQAYGSQGYIAQAARLEPRLDDASHRAVFAITVEQGPQFHMGTLTFAGIRESDATMLAKKWKLKPGDVYDESYQEKYLREEIGPLQTAAGGRGQFTSKVDGERHVVDVQIVFK
jgi:outer membrane protein assembly factor BamA